MRGIALASVLVLVFMVTPAFSVDQFASSVEAYLAGTKEERILIIAGIMQGVRLSPAFAGSRESVSS
jgi:uncharacterized metal-binding protein